MQDYNICYEGWDGDPKIEEMARTATQLLIDRGATTIVQVTLKIALGYEYTGTFLVSYDPSQSIKIYDVEFKYRNYNICLRERGVNVWWKNAIKNGVDASLQRMDIIDKQIKTNSDGSYGKF